MSDLDQNELAQAFLRRMETKYREEGIKMGQELPRRLVDYLFHSFGGEIRPEDAQQFTVGYDSGTGTSFLPFTTDKSILTTGATGDILTG